MKVEESRDVTALQRALDPLVGREVSGVRLSEAGSLRVDFTDGASTRPCWLGVYSIAWRLDGRQAVLAASQDAPEGLLADVQVLRGKRLTSVDVRPLSMDTTFRLADVDLRIFPAFSGSDDEDSVYWSLRLPTGFMFCAGPGAAWSVRRALR
ncbi:hypothetical protein [Streptacidiphilus rugosus]|uniref:hypothetical protein n=1 Tax=Streptacidiphilus rugosus TaxID=405783 RepID=UPI0012F80934|nr:hypothetical protein [Streptacidiphilus rugosus]